MYPHERSLVEKHKDRPFALIGVNSDSDREKLKETVKEKNLTWRSFWDGGSTNGPIAKQWQVKGWPTIYLIDHKGIVRHENLRGDALDQAIEELLAGVRD